MKCGILFAAAACGAVYLGCQAATLTSAKLYLEEGNHAKAAEQVESALSQEPANPETHFVAGRLAAVTRRYAAMDSALNRAVNLDPSYGDRINDLRQQFWIEEYNQGVQQLSEEPADLAAAGRSFRNAIQIDPEPIDAWRNLAYVAYHLDSTVVAIEANERILEKEQDDAAALSSLGLLYLRVNLPESAVAVLEELMRLTPSDYEAQVNLGVAYEESGQLRSAENAYRQAIEIDPAVGMAHYNLGNLYWNEKNHEAAIAAYEKAVELDPDDHNTLYNLAVCYLSTDEVDAALPILVDLAAKMPDNSLIWRELGRVYAIKGRLDESERAYEQADQDRR